MENKARKELAVFLEERDSRLPLSLDELFRFLRLWTKVLSAEKRWKKYAKRDTREDMPETVLEHIVDCVFIGAQLIAAEKHYGSHVSLELRPNELYLAFIVYGLRVALRGDIALMDMTEEDLRREKEDFQKMLFPADAHNDFVRAYNISKEREEAAAQGRPLQSVSANGQFLWAVVVSTFLGKSLLEVKRGNWAWANTFHNMQEDVEYLCRKFHSFDEKVKPQLAAIKGWMKAIPRWKE